MDSGIVNLAIRTFLREARERLEEAAGIAKAAEACAAAGKPDKGVEIANDLDGLVHEVEQLLGMAAAMTRISSDRTARDAR